MTKKILFNDKYCLTHAVLAGQKTMIRRVLKDNVSLGNWEETKKHLPYKVGEVVAIAQCYKELYPNADFEMVGNGFMTESAGWNNKMFVRANLMKRHIKITDVKVERLQDISDDDIMREGVWQFYDQKNLFYVFKSIGYAHVVAFLSARKAFAYLIDMVSGKGTWNRNPCVVVYTFERID